MSFDDSDLRELFQRAFDERDRERRGEEPSGEGPRRPQRPTLPDGWWRNRWLWIGGLLLVLFLSFNWIVTTYTEYLWFDAAGYRSVFMTTLLARAGAFAAFFALAFALLAGNALLAARSALATSRSAFKPGEFGAFRLFLLLLAALLAFLFGSAAASNWEGLLQFVNGAPSDVRDPVFGRSLTFYFFQLPLYNYVRGWLIPLLFFSIVGVIGIYAAHNLEEVRRGWRPQTIDPLRRHVAVLGAALALLIALGHWLSRYELLTSSSPAQLVAGAGYADMNVTAPLLLLNATLMGVVAVALLLNARQLTLRPLIAALGLWFVAVLLTGLLPGVVERYVVIPNQLGRERPYLAHAIQYTRQAYGLDNVTVREFDRITPLTVEALTQNVAALNNIRLWDYRVLPDNYEQLQALRTYYQFGDVDVDRYEVDGQVRQVMLAARELEKSALTNRSWENLRLEFTHGFGVVMNPVDRFTRDGQPEFFISEIPPASTTDIVVTQPEIYYGEMLTPDDVVFVGSPRGEFSYPSGEQNVRTTYAGRGGVPVGGFLRKLAFAIRFGEINILINNDLTPETRVMFHRQIAERVRHITPFLTLDADPYIIVHDGRLVWMIDAYTTTNAYPYSDRVGAGLNYIRNVAKITIDAYDGTVTYYLIDDSDPIVQTYAAIFPDLFRPLAEMPQGLQKHIRYPETLFRIQTQLYLEYHMTDVNVYFNQEDVWAIPLETFGENEARQLEPYYVLFRLPGEAQTEYLLIQPYTPNGRDNMVAWLAGRSDPPNYGQLVAYKLPKQAVVDGPVQVEAQIEQDSEISPLLALWNEGSSRAIRGNLLVIPLDNSFLYIEPLYLQSAGEGSRPELKRVIAASGGRVVMRETLNEALAALIGVSDITLGDGSLEVEVGNADLPLPPASSGVDATGVDATVVELVTSANANFTAAQAAQRAGDWAAYGEALDRLERDLEQLRALVEPSP